MIQFFINSRPVPRAIARHRIQEANPQHSPQYIQKRIKEAIAEDCEAIRFLESFGVSIVR